MRAQVRRATRAHKVRRGPAANAAHPYRREPLARRVRPGLPVPRGTPARRRRLASSLGRIPLVARRARSWLDLSARVARPTERNAQRPARRRPVSASVGDLTTRSEEANAGPRVQRLLLGSITWLTLARNYEAQLPRRSLQKKAPPQGWGEGLTGWRGSQGIEGSPATAKAVSRKCSNRGQPGSPIACGGAACSRTFGSGQAGGSVSKSVSRLDPDLRHFSNVRGHASATTAVGAGRAGPD
jgi:hypothetical protein